MHIKNHILGYSKVLQKHAKGLDFVLEHGENALSKFESESFKDWYFYDKPSFFQYLNIFENEAQNENLNLCFFIYPIQIRVSYGFEELPELTNLVPPGSFIRESKRENPNLTQREINERWVVKACEYWQKTLSWMSNKRIEPFLSKDPSREKRLPLLRGSLDLENLQVCASNLQVTIDRIMEGKDL